TSCNSPSTPSYSLSPYLLPPPPPPRTPPSFPTRRSSDLQLAGDVRRGLGDAVVALASEPQARRHHGELRFHRHVRPSADRRHKRSEEHTSELQSPCNLVCRLLLEKKKKKYI